MEKQYKKMNKKGFLFRHFVVTIVLFSAVIIFMSNAFSGMASEYGRDDLVDPTFAANYDQLQEVQDSTGTSLNVTRSGQGSALVGNFDVSFKSTFTVIALAWNSLTTFGDRASQISENVGFIDAEPMKTLIGIGIVIITIILIFGFITSISRGKL